MFSEGLKTFRKVVLSFVSSVCYSKIIISLDLSVGIGVHTVTDQLTHNCQLISLRSEKTGGKVLETKCRMRTGVTGKSE